MANVTKAQKAAAGKVQPGKAYPADEALKLVKQRDPGDDRGTELWLAVRHHYVPVRVLVVEKDGTRLDQVATRVAAE